MELLKYVNKIKRTNEILDQIDEKGLDADFLSIYNQLIAEGDLNIIPERIFKWIEDVATGEFMQEQGEYDGDTDYDHRFGHFKPYEGQVLAWEIRQ